MARASARPLCVRLRGAAQRGQQDAARQFDARRSCAPGLRNDDGRLPAETGEHSEQGQEAAAAQ